MCARWLKKRASQTAKRAKESAEFNWLHVSLALVFSSGLCLRARPAPPVVSFSKDMQDFFCTKTEDLRIE